MVYHSILLIEHELDPTSLEAIVRPDETDARTTVAGVENLLTGFRLGSLSASGVGMSGTLGVNISGSVPDVAGLSVNTYHLDLT